MEYPGSHVTKPIRTIILVFFIVLFLVLAPGIILYTSGYRYDWQYGLLRETGSINVDISPDTAAVYVNGAKIKSKMPVRLNDRVPGKYTIKISAEGYYDWQKEVLVKNKQTVYIKDISMLKINSPVNIAAAIGIDSLKISYDKKFLLYTTHNSYTAEARLYRLSDGEDILVTSLAANEGLQIEFAPNNNYFSVSDANSPHKTLLIFNADDLSKKINIVERIGYPADKYQWNESVEPELYFNANKRLMSVVATNEQRFVLGKNVWLDWYMQNGQLWTLQYASGTKQIKIVRDTLGFNNDYAGADMFTAAEQDLRFVKIYDNVAVLKKFGQAEMILLDNGKKYNIAGEKYLLSDFDEWLVVWTPWEIWTYSRGEEPNLLNRSGVRLNDVVPLDKHNTLALFWADKTTALFPYYLVTHDFISSSVNAAAVDAANRALYFAGTINGTEGLWKINY